jgi:hypothetical protein
MQIFCSAVQCSAAQCGSGISLIYSKEKTNIEKSIYRFFYIRKIWIENRDNFVAVGLEPSQSPTNHP